MQKLLIDQIIIIKPGWLRIYFEKLIWFISYYFTKSELDKQISYQRNTQWLNQFLFSMYQELVKFVEHTQVWNQIGFSWNQNFELECVELKSYENTFHSNHSNIRIRLDAFWRAGMATNYFISKMFENCYSFTNQMETYTLCSANRKNWFVNKIKKSKIILTLECGEVK